MSYFPFFIDIKDKKCLVVGGGKVALRKVTKLSGFGCDITVVSPSFIDEFYKIEGIKLIEQGFESSLLEGCFFVITATSDKKLNEEISNECKELGILVNSSDGKDESSFIFPALVKRGDLVTGICTSGASPSASSLIRESIEGVLPDHIDEILDWLDEKRPFVLKEYPEDKRSLVMRLLYTKAVLLGHVPDENETIQILSEVDKYE